MQHDQPNTSAAGVEDVRAAVAGVAISLDKLAAAVRGITEVIDQVPMADLLRMSGSFGGPSVDQAAAASIDAAGRAVAELHTLRRAIRRRKGNIVVALNRSN